MDLGALCLPGERERIHAIVMDAQEKGAKVLAGGTLSQPNSGSGQLYPPTLVVGVTEEMR